MISGYTTPRCLCCRDGALPHSTPARQRPGSPLRKCPQCGKTHFDARYAEPAFAYYNKKRPSPRKLYALLVAVGTCASVTKPFAKYCHTYAPQYETPIYAVSFTIIGILLVIYLFHTLYRRWRKDAYYERFEQRKLARLSRDAKGFSKLAASLRRLSQADYLYELMAYGVIVPLFFFKRISVAPEPQRIKEAMAEYAEKKRQLLAELRHREEELHQQQTAQKLKSLQEEAEYFKYYLSLGPADRRFQKQAALHNMSPQAFQSHCKESISRIQDEIYSL